MDEKAVIPVRSAVLLAALMAASVPAAAQTLPRSQGLPAINAVPPGYPPPVKLYPDSPTELTPKEQAALKAAAPWRDSNAILAQGDDGRVIFQFGQALPPLVCAPLQICEIALQPGEIVNDINAGDTVRWKITPSISGAGPDRTTHVVIKPTTAPLKTTLLITTNRRAYMLELVADPKQWMPRVAFAYPEDTARAWAKYKETVAETTAATVLPTGQNVASLDFNYTLSGDTPAWRPVRVYATAVQTFIQFPPNIKSGDLPALVGLGDGDTTTIINYRTRHGTMIVDKVIDRAALIYGVGSSQTRVVIKHGEGQ
ncbi:MAG: P-type conjugative transfer protein TrbG [Magnetospirillum sp.]|nr:P-type conjugative transfer protein TrbG [Magnetospirillum sp.]